MHVEATVADCLWHFAQEHSSIVILKLLEDGQIVARNRCAEVLFGNLLAPSLSDLLVSFKPGADPFQELLAAEVPLSVLLQTQRGLPTTLTAVLAHTPEGLLFLASPDMDELEHFRHESVQVNNELGALSRQVQKANAELERLHELKNRFLAMATHDLRKPLGLVMAYCDLLVDGDDDSLSAQQHQFIERIQRASRSMQTLVDDFLDVALIEAGRFPVELAAVDLSTLLEQALEMVSPTAARRGVALVQLPMQGPRSWVADASKLEQVVVNLVGNAVEHSASGQVVEVEARVAEDQATLLVMDRGPGIPAELRESLFKPYEHSGSRVRSEHGTGLGLAIAHLIIRAHDGTIQPIDREGGGTTFEVTLPHPKRGKT